MPTEVEWEYVARGGLEQKKYLWGDELMAGNKHYCNIWQGKFPYENTKEDRYIGTAPVKSYSPNGFGLYQISGNVWEWCADQLRAVINNLMGGNGCGAYVFREVTLSYLYVFRTHAAATPGPNQGRRMS